MLLLWSCKIVRRRQFLSGHESEMVAEVYLMDAHDAQALNRMGIFTRIALAFHLRSSIAAHRIVLLLSSLCAEFS